MKDDRIHLNHILECIQAILQFTESGGKTFKESKLIQDAVLRNLQTLGQSVSRLSDALRAAHPEVDWRGIIGFRNVLVHDYLGINLTRVWEIVENELPGLREKVTAILKTL